MFFIGIVSEEKNEKHIKDILKQKIENENVVFINEKNIENIKNIKFKIIVLNKIRHIQADRDCTVSSKSKEQQAGT